MVLGLFGKKRDPNAPRPILVVDDDKDVASFIQDVLLSSGYQAITANDGEKAVAAAKAENPCLILLDINMPGWSGLRTLTQLRVEEETRAIPVLMVTAEQMGRDVEDAFKRGAKGYVIKPVDIPRLLKKVAEIVPRPAS